MNQASFWVLDGGHRGIKHVPIGFSWAAAAFGPFWAMWRGSTALLAAFSAGATLLYLMPGWLATPYSPALSKTLPVLIGAVYIACIGAFAHTWLRMALEADGFKLAGQTHMRIPQPPRTVGELAVKHYAVVTWPPGSSPPHPPDQRQPVAGYLIAQHERENAMWYLVSTDVTWTPMEEIQTGSLEKAKALADAQAPSLRDNWRVLQAATNS